MKIKKKKEKNNDNNFIYEPLFIIKSQFLCYKEIEDSVIPDALLWQKI